MRAIDFPKILNCHFLKISYFLLFAVSSFALFLLCLSVNVTTHTMNEKLLNWLKHLVGIGCIFNIKICLKRFYEEKKIAFCTIINGI